MSSRPKKGRPQANLQRRVEARRKRALERRKADLAEYRALTMDQAIKEADGDETLAAHMVVMADKKREACKRDIAGLEKNLGISVKEAA